MTTITITGLPQLYRRLTAAAATETLVPPMQRAQARIWRRAATYTQSTPPKPTGSTYVRRFILAKGWTVRPVRRLSNGVEAQIGNNIEYAPLVKASRFQRAIFRGRWPTVEQDIEAELPTITADFQRAVDRALGSR